MQPTPNWNVTGHVKANPNAEGGARGVLVHKRFTKVLITNHSPGRMSMWTSLWNLGQLSSTLAEGTKCIHLGIDTNPRHTTSPFRQELDLTRRCKRQVTCLAGPWPGRRALHLIQPSSLRSYFKVCGSRLVLTTGLSLSQNGYGVSPSCRYSFSSQVPTLPATQTAERLRLLRNPSRYQYTQTLRLSDPPTSSLSD